MLSTLWPSSWLLHDITNTMTTLNSSLSTSTLASIVHSHTPTTLMVQKNPFLQNPIESEMHLMMHFDVDAEHNQVEIIIVDDSVNSVSLCGVDMMTAGVENMMMASVYTTILWQWVGKHDGKCVVFAGPVCWTEKKTEIKLNPTAKGEGKVRYGDGCLWYKGAFVCSLRYMC